MASVFFDPRRTEYKSHFGAVTAGTEIEFHIDCDVDERAVLAVGRDGSERVRIPLYRDERGLSCRFTFAEAGLYFYGFELDGGRFVCRGADGRGYISEEADSLFQQTVYDAAYEAPRGWAGGIMYQIFPDRFAVGRSGVNPSFDDRVLHEDFSETPNFRPDADGKVRNNDYFGGNLEGIREKLPYLASLGIDIVYFNPVFESHSNHRYDTADYLKMDPMLGTEKDFTRLCADAKKSGIKIVLDGVFSHTGADSVYFNRYRRYERSGAFDDERSPYRRWYKFSPDGKSCKSWWGFENLPEVNECDVSFVEFICGADGVIDKWMGAGASGFRLDVADELPDDFIEKIRVCIKAHGRDKILIGEVWEDASNKISYGYRRSYLLGRQLDSVMNYPFRDAILGFIRDADAEGFMNRVMTIVENYPKPMLDLMMNSLSTHDTERAITALADGRSGDREWQSKQMLSKCDYLRGAEMLKLAGALQYTLPGIPCVYYGDEIGMQGFKDPFNRGFFRWDAIDENLLKFFRKLARTRKKYPAFADGAIKPVAARDGVAAFIRENKKQAVGVALNRSEQTAKVPFPNGQTVTVEPWRFVIERL